MFCRCIATLSLLAPVVVGHGYLASVAIDGKTYQGNDVPHGTNNPSVIRAVNSINPVKGATNPDVNCGASAKAAKLVADAKPGSKFEFGWESGEDTDWPHNTGAVLTYMADCGSQTCDQFDSTKAKWFKIQEAGIVNSGSPVTWAQASIMQGKKFEVTMPSNIAPGNFLVRHELIALQLATSQGGAEFYPSCTQVKISGSGTGKPKSSELVSLPGAYKDTDPGILDANVFNPGHKYTPPGPPVASFVTDAGSASDSSTPSGSGSDANSEPSSTESAASSPSSTPTSKPCKRSKAKRNAAHAKREGVKIAKRRL